MIAQEYFMQRHNHLTLKIPAGLFCLALLFVLAGEAAQAVPNGGYAHPEIIIQPEELRSLIDRKDPDIRIIDVREKPKYTGGHIPGAAHVWRPDIEDKQHSLPGMMASKGQVEDLLGKLGIRDKSILIIYSDLYDHARLWWVLAYYGFPLHQMKLLDGGIDGWLAKGYPAEIIEPTSNRSIFKFPEITGRKGGLLCGFPEVKSALGNPGKVVLDVRTKKEYAGEEMKRGAQKPGRIPGVVWIEWKETIVQEGPSKGFWKSADEIKKIFSARGVTPDKEIYLY
jgi:thiosulfate/3-mercaptopyruvate sulfurtransferase